MQRCQFAFRQRERDLAAAGAEPSLELAECFPDKPRSRQTRLRLQAAAAFLGVEIYASVKVDTGLRSNGHRCVSKLDASMLPTFEIKARKLVAESVSEWQLVLAA
jgi:hypothetical protein